MQKKAVPTDFPGGMRVPSLPLGDRTLGILCGAVTAGFVVGAALLRIRRMCQSIRRCLQGLCISKKHLSMNVRYEHGMTV